MTTVTVYLAVPSDGIAVPRRPSTPLGGIASLHPWHVPLEVGAAASPEFAADLAFGAANVFTDEFAGWTEAYRAGGQRSLSRGDVVEIRDGARVTFLQVEPCGWKEVPAEAVVELAVEAPWSFDVEDAAASR